MKLYVRWGTFWSPRPGGHPCGNAHRALRKAGWDPEVVKSYGAGILPDALNRDERPPGGPQAHRATDGPVLVTDDGEVSHGSRRIVDWARTNPAVAPIKQVGLERH